jgi:hypothetical protein
VIDILPKPMRDLEKDEVKWFIEIDETPITENELYEAKQSLKVFQDIKSRKS